jgi:hypothetical protein
MVQTEKQQQAFAKARAVRDANLKRKFLAEQAEEQKQQQEPAQSNTTAGETEPDVESDETAPPQAQYPPAPQAQYAQQQQQAMEAPQEKKQAVVPQQAEQDDYIELDVDSLFSQLQKNQKDISDLRDHIGHLRQGHELINNEWQRLSGNNCDIKYV